MSSLRAHPRVGSHRQRSAATLITFLAVAACAPSPPRTQDASSTDASALDAGREPDTSIDAAGPIPDGACLMVSPEVRCGDGVCDPGCEANAPQECPLDCPLPEAGIPCTDGPDKWTCNDNESALLRCRDGVLHLEPCGAPGSCHRVAGNYPDQCHACVPCTGWNSASPAHGQPYVYNCSADRTRRERCVDVRTGGDCIQGTSETGDCCVVTDTCLGGTCTVRAVGVDDSCP